MTADRDAISRDRRGKFAKTLESAERDREACRLKARGESYAAISDRLGYGGEANARRAITACLAAVPADAVEELRAIQNRQLDELTRVVIEVLERRHLVISASGKVVEHGDTTIVDDGPVLAAVDRLLKIMERRAKINGLDAPQRTEVLSLDVIDSEIARLTAELGGTEA